MIYRVAVLICLSLLSFSLKAEPVRVDLPEVLFPLIEEEIKRAKLDLDKNRVSIKSQVSGLKASLDKVWGRVQKEGFSEDVGIDSELRPGYVTMQGIIELAITRALNGGLVKTANAYLVTPRMPTSLMLLEGRSLREVDLSDAWGFAAYRRPILISYLSAGGVLKAFYSHKAKETVLLSQSSGVANYARLCAIYSNLIDFPVIKVDMEQFPGEMAGAVYVVDGYAITIESRQVSQIDHSAESKWAIRFGEKAEDRRELVDDFVKFSESRHPVDG